METIKQLSKLEILNETISFYSEDITRRAITTINDVRKCMYNTEDNRHCAVGRCLIEKIHNEGTNFNDNNSTVCDLDNILGLDNILQPQYKGHERSFWQYLQDLHDTERNWGENGLTDGGKLFVERIKTMFDIKE